jgi:hypothetical protein
MSHAENIRVRTSEQWQAALPGGSLMRGDLGKTPLHRRLSPDTGKSVEREAALVIVAFVLIAAHVFGLGAQALKLLPPALG